MKITVRNMTYVALFAAITAVCAQIAIPVPFSPVPFTLQVVAVCLAGGILGSKLGALSLIVYLLIGATGMPVFAQFNGGLSVIAGPTGGFLLSFPIAAALIGFIMEQKSTKLTSVISMTLGLLIIYIMGYLQFKYVTGFSWMQSFTYAVAPYVLPDIIKIIMTSILVLEVNQSLTRNNLKPTSVR